MAAGIAITLLINRRKLALILGVAQVYSAVDRKDGARARLAAGGDAIESICAILYANKEVIWFTDPQEVARLIAGEFLAHPFDDRP